MFSFHKPKVYRSTQGCCICKAKSSSSRFTDSKKYELDFIECFQLETPRKGEICNACVLLVKRFKRLPPGSERHWGHVVDARVGPGLKSMTKFKKRKEEQLQAQSLSSNGSEHPVVIKDATSSVKVSCEVTAPTARSFSIPEKFGKIFKKNKKKKLNVEKEDDKKSAVTRFKYIQETKIVTRRSSQYISALNDDDDMLETGSTASSPRYHPHSDDNMDTEMMFGGRSTDIFNKTHHEINRNFIETILSVHQNKVSKRYRRKNERPIKNLQQKLLRPDRSTVMSHGHVDANVWTRLKTCCGYVFESRKLNAVILDADLYKMCAMHQFAATRSRLIVKTEKENGLINGNVKVTDRVNVPSTAVKKHHLYSKRQNMVDAHPDFYKTESIIVHSATTSAQQPAAHQSLAFAQNHIMFSPSPVATVITAPPPTAAMMLGHDKYSNNTYHHQQLHKLKSDGRVVKGVINRVDGVIPTAKLKSTDLSLVKNLVKMCTDKTNKKVMTATDGKTENAVDALGNKFSDNSSDSGYEETPAEQSMNVS